MSARRQAEGPRTDGTGAGRQNYEAARQFYEREGRLGY